MSETETNAQPEATPAPAPPKVTDAEIEAHLAATKAKLLTSPNHALWRTILMATHGVDPFVDNRSAKLDPAAEHAARVAVANLLSEHPDHAAFREASIAHTGIDPHRSFLDPSASSEERQAAHANVVAAILAARGG